MVKLLTLKCEFEMLQMKENEDVKTYITKVIKVVNQIRLTREDFPYS